MEPEPVPPANPAQTVKVTSLLPDCCCMVTTALWSMLEKFLGLLASVRLLVNNIRPKRRRCPPIPAVTRGPRCLSINNLSLELIKAGGVDADIAIEATTCRSLTELKRTVQEGVAKAKEENMNMSKA